MIRQQHLQRAYNRVAHHYQTAASMQFTVGNRLLERLAYLKINPQTIVDLGCGLGTFITPLKNKYPKARVIGLDLALDMLRCYKVPLWSWNKPKLVLANMERLPFADGSIDLLFANQVIHWASDTAALFAELNRILHPQGVIMFSTVGPDTALELRRAWAGVDQYQHVNEFKDLHDLGDELLASGFADPVVDMEYIKVRYSNPASLLKDIKQQGIQNLHPQRLRGLTGKHRFQQFLNNLTHVAQQQAELALTYEVIYGHAWQKVPIKDSTAVKIPLNAIGGLSYKS